MPELKDLAKDKAALDGWPSLPRLLEAGFFAAHTGKVFQARALFTGLLQARPGLVRARLGMAFSHLVANEFDQAEAGLNEILEASPENPEALALLGLCLTLSGRLEEAGQALGRIEDAAGPPFELAKFLRSLE